MIGKGALGIARRSRRIEDGGKVVRPQLAEHAHGGVAIARDRGKARFVMVEHHDTGAVLDPVEAGGTRCIGQDQRTFAQVDSVGELFARPPTVQQRGAAARHDRAHIGDRPLGRIARRDADPIAFLDAVPGRQTMRHFAGGGVNLAEGQTLIAVHQEQRLLVLIAEMGEIMRQAGRRVDEGGHVDPAACHGLQGEHLSIGGHGIGDAVNVAVEIGLHKVRLSSLEFSEGVSAGVRAFAHRPAVPKAAPDEVASGGFRTTYKG